MCVLYIIENRCIIYYAIFIAILNCPIYQLYIMCVKINKKSQRKNITGIMNINEEKTQETTPSTTATLEAASDEAITDINVLSTRDASQAEELFDAGQS
ncbi:MAG: hypothetical protein IJ587_12670, partial [Synergistaceae bacterium]|nr:hypothetical protein [Synergistaceae bacterium]